MQSAKAISKPSNTAKIVALSAMFAALVTVTTAFIKVPTPLGYVHAGDSMVYLAASVLPGPFGLIAASIGGGLADLISGYPHWAIPTAIIKALNVLPFLLCRLALKNSVRYRRIINLPNLLMVIPSTVVTLGGYLLANAFFHGFAAAFAAVIPHLLQVSPRCCISRSAYRSTRSGSSRSSFPNNQSRIVRASDRF